MNKAWLVITRYSAIAAIVFVWIIFVIGMFQVHLRLLDSRPLSYLGVSDYAPYFKLGLLVGLVSMGLFYLYLKRTFRPTKLFRNLYFTGLAMQLIVSFTSYQIDNKPQLWHWAAALILAAALVFSPWVFSKSRNISETTRHIGRDVTLAYLVVLVVETILLIKFKYYAVSELFNLVVFHAWIIYLTFVNSVSA